MSELIKYCAFLVLYMFIFILSVIMLKTTSQKLKETNSKGMYLTKGYNLMSKFFMFASVFSIIISIIMIIEILQI